MIGVTIGIGAEWAPVAERAASRMAKMTGIQCKVITEADGIELAHPSWLKCFIPDLFEDEDEFMVFDADIICLQEWDPEGLFELLGRPFCAVPEPNSLPVINECQVHGLPLCDWYVNGGFTIYGREHASIWSDVWARHPKYGSWLEQTALNAALLKYRGPICRLPRSLNALAHRGEFVSSYAGVTLDQVINLHCCSINSAAGVLRAQTNHGLA